ncbi:MAG: DUF748 domain-containing protein [Candidatus Synoicihabitans palmerolidicus]|nr:DUF748 domain-containing protein [Candidatus Synoicihabitans palmerolidicus]
MAVELVEGRVALADQSLAPPAKLAVETLSGMLTGWSTEEPGKGELSLQGKVNGTGPVAIRGAFNPLSRPAYSQVKIDFDRIALLPLDGYIGKYAGYGLERGRMSLDIDFELKDRELRSETVATLYDFTLGTKVENPDATKLLVSLAVALLKDAAGEIVIDVPVRGNLDDLEFRVGRVVWRVITNLLTKAATAPFAMLGALVGGDAEVAWAEQSFEAGGAELNEQVIQNLDTLAQALRDRPALNLTIVGSYDRMEDERALRPMILEQELRERGVGGTVHPREGLVGEGTGAAFGESLHGSFRGAAD